MQLNLRRTSRAMLVFGGAAYWFTFVAIMVQDHLRKRRVEKPEKPEWDPFEYTVSFDSAPTRDIYDWGNIEHQRKKRALALSGFGHWGPKGLTLGVHEEDAEPEADVSQQFNEPREIRPHFFIKHGSWWMDSSIEQIENGHRLLHKWAFRPQDSDHDEDDLTYAFEEKADEPRRRWWQRKKHDPVQVYVPPEKESSV